MRKLQARERLVLAVGALFVLGVVLAALLRGGVGTLRRLDAQIDRRQAQVEEMRELLERHRVLQAQLAALERKLERQGAEPFLSQLGELMAEARLQSHLEGIVPQRDTELEGVIESTVEVKLSRLHLGQVVDLLRRVSLGQSVVQIQRLHLQRRYENPGELDVALVLASYQAKR